MTLVFLSKLQLPTISFDWRGCLKKLILIVAIVIDRHPS
jgi:hypothetical protein